MAILVKPKTIPISALKTELIRHSLHKVLRIPVRASQLTGSFIFYLNSNAELSFSCFGWPLITNILQLSLSLIALILFVLHKKEYFIAFGNWSTVDLITNSLITLLPFSLDIFSSFTTYKGRHNILSFHNKQLIPFIIEILEEYSSSDDLIKRLKTVMTKQIWLSYKVYVLVAFSFVAYLAGLASSLTVATALLKTTPNFNWVLANIPFILVFMVARTIMCKAQFLVISGILSFIWFGLAALKDHLSSLIQEGTLEDEAKVNKCLHNFKRINDLIKELNSTSQWVFINGMLTMLTTVLCYFFQFFSWYAEFGAAALVGLAPGIIPCLVTLHCLCEAASAIEIEGKYCIISIRDLGSCNWVCASQELSNKIKRCHLVGVLQPPLISPGYFFTIRRSIVPSILAIVFTYLLVLVQFQQMETEKMGSGRADIVKILMN